MRNRNFALGTLSILALIAAGCGGGASSTSSVASTLATNPTGKITTFTTVAATKAGTVFYLILDRVGGKVTVPIKLTGTSDDANGRIIYFSVANHPFGAGDSGSLVIDSKGNSVGALTAGYEGSSTVLSVTSIEDEESILAAGPTVKKPASASGAPGTGLVRLVRGVSPYLWGVIQKDKRNAIPSVFKLDSSAPLKGRPGMVADASTTPYSTTIFMISSYGDAVSAYSTGCITTPYLGKLICYGQPLNWEGGSQDIPCCYGSVLDFVTDSLYGDEKLAVPNLAKTAGTLVDDRRFGVVVDPTVTATPITVSGTVTLNTNPAVTFNGYVSQDALYETSFALLNVSQGTSDVVNASEIAGSATGTATVNFADGSSQTVDLTDAGSSTLISDLYYNISNVMFDPNTGEPLPLASITFSFNITTS